MLERLYADTAKLPESQFIEIAYDDLDASPMECLGRIYDRLQLDGFDGVRPQVERYLERVSGYRKNPHRFDAATLDKVDSAWGPVAGALGLRAAGVRVSRPCWPSITLPSDSPSAAASVTRFFLMS